MKTEKPVDDSVINAEAIRQAVAKVVIGLDREYDGKSITLDGVMALHLARAQYLTAAALANLAIVLEKNHG